MVVSQKKTLVLIDSHAILHRAFHALPSFTSPKGEPTGALYGFTAMLLRILKEFEPQYIAACYDLPEPTFRHEFYEKYKAQRPKMDEELVPQIANSKKILTAFGIPFYEKKGFEADDLLASIVEQLKKEKKLKIVIVTGDLDALQLVRPAVNVYMMKKGVRETVLYDEKAVIERFGFQPELLPDFKGLRGDPSDNIPGVSGIGEKTAMILVQNFGSLENVYKKISARGGKNKKELERAGVKERIINLLKENEEEALFSKSLAQMRFDVPVSFSVEDSKWSVDFDRQKIEALFWGFGFRSLLQRLPAVVQNQTDEVELPLGSSTSEHSEELKKEIKVAFWLLDSRRINPNLRDALNHTGASDMEDARKKLVIELKRDGLFELFEKTERPLAGVLQKMTERGALLDTVYLKNLSKDYHGKLDILEEDIWKMAGEKFNINSPQQMASVLFEKMGISPKGLRRTAGGSFSTRFSELEKIKDNHPIIEKIFSYRELSKLTSTYIDNLPKFVGKDARLHASFNQTGTTTGRLSSSEPNLQNIPVKSEFGRAVRRAFVAPIGWKLVSFDYSQIELRVVASLSGDKKLKEAFLRGDDIHAKVASEVFNVPAEKVTGEMRRRAKIINFGIIYGMGINSLKKNLECGREEAESFYAEYMSDFSGVAGYLEKIKKEVSEKGFSETFFKRRRYLPEINSPIDFIRKEAERMAVNAPIQGTAADIIKMAMAALDDVGARLIIQVHDELLFEIKDSGDTIKEMATVIKKTMESDKYLDVPLLVDVLAGQNWVDMERIKI